MSGPPWIKEYSGYIEAAPWNTGKDIPVGHVIEFTLETRTTKYDLSLKCTKETIERLMAIKPTRASVFMNGKYVIPILANNPQLRDFDILRLRPEDDEW